MVLRRPLPAWWRPGAITFIVLAVLSLLLLSLLDRNGIVPPPFTKEVLFAVSVVAGVAVALIGRRKQHSQSEDGQGPR